MADPKVSDAWDRWELPLQFCLQFSLIAGLMALSVWLWPAGLFDAHTNAISFLDWFLACISVWLALLALLTIYFLFVEPIVDFIQDNKEVAMDLPDEYPSDQK